MSQSEKRFYIVMFIILGVMFVAVMAELMFEEINTLSLLIVLTIALVLKLLHKKKRK